MTGITGAAIKIHAAVGEAVKRIKSHTDLPVAVGFGIKTADDAAIIGRDADGVVVGTALCNAVARLAGRRQGHRRHGRGGHHAGQRAGVGREARLSCVLAGGTPSCELSQFAAERDRELRTPARTVRVRRTILPQSPLRRAAIAPRDRHELDRQRPPPENPVVSQQARDARESLGQGPRVRRDGVLPRSRGQPVGGAGLRPPHEDQGQRPHGGVPRWRQIRRRAAARRWRRIR